VMGFDFAELLCVLCSWLD